MQDEIDKLSLELRDAEILRKNAQDALEKAGENMNVKANMLGPMSDVQACDPDLEQSFRNLTDQLKQKSQHDNQLRKTRDQLLLEKLRKKGKDDLFDQIDRAGKEFDIMSEGLQN